jgi:hypothetical protein
MTPNGCDAMLAGCEDLRASCANVAVCEDFVIRVNDPSDKNAAYMAGEGVCAARGATLSVLEFLDVGVFVTCCANPSGTAAAGGASAR